MTLSRCASCMCDCLICGWSVVPYRPPRHYLLPSHRPLALPLPAPPIFMLWLECVREFPCVVLPSLAAKPAATFTAVLTRPTSCRCRGWNQRGDHVHGGTAEGRHRAGGGQRGGQPRHAVPQGQGAKAHCGPHTREEGREGEVAAMFTWTFSSLIVLGLLDFFCFFFF